jgi:hypothetical protein
MKYFKFTKVLLFYYKTSIFVKLETISTKDEFIIMPPIGSMINILMHALLDLIHSGW